MFKTMLAAVVLSVLPSLAFAYCGGSTASMSCASGQVYDSTTGTCVDQTA
ncbi:MAG: hypothetical protein ACPGID_11350 [Rubricella sp.]